MPKFFVPAAKSPEQAEQAYAAFGKNSETYPLSHTTARLFRITFVDRGNPCVVEIGENVLLRGENPSIALAIIETTELVFVHTVLRGGRSGAPILVSPDEVSERVYFDDFPDQP